MAEWSPFGFVGPDAPAVEAREWGIPPYCRPGSTPVDGTCEPSFFCPWGFHRNDKTGWCDPDKPVEYCGPDAWYDHSRGTCIPNPCPQPYYQRDGQCVHALAGQPCCPDRAWNEPCLSDRVWDEHGQCISKDFPHCHALYGPHAHYDAATGRCECEEGMVRSENPRGCVPAAPGPTSSSGPSVPEPPPAIPVGWWFLSGLAAGAVGVVAARTLLGERE